MPMKHSPSNWQRILKCSGQLGLNWSVTALQPHCSMAACSPVTSRRHTQLPSNDYGLVTYPTTSESSRRNHPIIHAVHRSVDVSLRPLMTEMRHALSTDLFTYIFTGSTKRLDLRLYCGPDLPPLSRCQHGNRAVSKQ
jgi:hypothetical protein